MPDRYADYTESWMLHHPDWSVRVWQDYDALPPLYNSDLFDEAKLHYPDDWKRFEADLLRLELLWQFGGVYADMDCVPIQNLGGLVDGRNLILGRSPQSVNGKHPITNALMSAPPQHPLIGLAILTMTDALEKHGNRHLAQSVGPWHLTRIYEADEWKNVTVFDNLYTSGLWVRHDWANAKRKRRLEGWRF